MTTSSDSMSQQLIERGWAEPGDAALSMEIGDIIVGMTEEVLALDDVEEEVKASSAVAGSYSIIDNPSIVVMMQELFKVNENFYEAGIRVLVAGQFEDFQRDTVFYKATK